MNPVMVWGEFSTGVEEQGKCVLRRLRNLGELISSSIVHNAANRASGKQITPG